MKIAGIQFACSPDKERNNEKALQLLAVALREDAKLICFQELFNLQWFPKDRDENTQQFAEKANGPTIRLFKNSLKGTDSVVILPIFEKSGQKYFNTSVVFNSDKTIGTYRKLHVTDIPLWDEKFYFSPGNQGLPVFQTPHGTIGIQVSWDNFYQEGIKILSLKGADIIFAPTACAFKSQHIWQTVLSGNAIANGVYIMRVNRVGSEAMQDFYGMSFCVNPEGELVGGPTGRTDSVLLADIDFEYLQHVRREWPILKGRRPACYKEIFMEASWEKNDRSV